MFRFTRLAGRICAVLATVFVLGASAAHADDLNWAITSVTFIDGGTITGSFSEDPTTGAITGWHITTTDGGAGFPGFTYDFANSIILQNTSAQGSLDFELQQQSVSGAPHLLAADAHTLLLTFDVTFAEALLDTGDGAIDFIGGGNNPTAECIGSNCIDAANYTSPGPTGRLSCYFFGCPSPGYASPDVPRDRTGGLNPNGSVPEPAAWALMLTGFAGIGATIRRRRRLVLQRA